MANQTALKNNCRASQPSVFPKNWQTGGTELLTIKWYITYRFYDDNLGLDKKVMIRDFNNVHTLKERRASVEDELIALRKALADGFNPFNRKKEDRKIVIPATKKVSEKMPFIDAIKFAYDKETESRGEANPTHKFFMPVLIKRATETGILNTPMCDVGRRDIKELLEKCGIKNDNTFSGDQFNRYRTMLHGFYRELIEYEICEANIPGAIQKKKAGTKTMRDTLADDQRAEVDKYLMEHSPEFRAYMHCFYHSGARSSEMLRLRVSDVDFKLQRIKYLVKKGVRYVEVHRPIPNVAVKYWQAVIGDAPATHYVFGQGLIPGETAIQPYQITKRFYRLIKKAKNKDGTFKFPGITADFYSLKHSKVSDLADEVGIGVAQGQFAERAGTLTKHYDTTGANRNDDILRKAGKEFA